MAPGLGTASVNAALVAQGGGSERSRAIRTAARMIRELKKGGRAMAASLSLSSLGTNQKSVANPLL